MNIQTKFNLSLTVALFLASNSIATEKSPQPHDGRLDEQLHLAKTNLPQKPPALLTNNNPSKLSITKEELAKHPDLIIRGLIPAVLQNNGEAVQLLLPLYQPLPKKDPFFIRMGGSN